METPQNDCVVYAVLYRENDWIYPLSDGNIHTT